MDDRYWILTPEKVVVGFRLGGLGSRVSAHLVDLLLVGAMVSAVQSMLGLLSFVLGPLLLIVSIIVQTFGIFLYFILQEGLWQGQTLGKKSTNLRVVMADGTPVTFAAALYRNLLRPADFLPILYGVGLFAIALNPRAQRLGDLAAGTVVVAERNPRPTGSMVSPHRYGLHPFEDSIGDLSRMTLEEYAALKRLCDRFPQLPPAAQARSVEEIWNPFAKRYRIAPILNVHPVYIMEAVVMKFGREHKLI